MVKKQQDVTKKATTAATDAAKAAPKKASETAKAATKAPTSLLPADVSFQPEKVGAIGISHLMSSLAVADAYSSDFTSEKQISTSSGNISPVGALNPFPACHQLLLVQHHFLLGASAGACRFQNGALHCEI